VRPSRPGPSSCTRNGCDRHQIELIRSCVCRPHTHCPSVVRSTAICKNRWSSPEPGRARWARLIGRTANIQRPKTRIFLTHGQRTRHRANAHFPRERTSSQGSAALIRTGCCFDTCYVAREGHTSQPTRTVFPHEIHLPDAPGSASLAVRIVQRASIGCPFTLPENNTEYESSRVPVGLTIMALPD